MDAEVITLKGVCKPAAGSTTPPPGCVSSLTRAQFEKMTKALTPPDKPPMPPDVVRNFATQYAKLLVFADTARELGLENDPRTQEIFQFARNQILTEALNQHIVQEYSHLSDQQIEDYYKQNPKKFMEANLVRIIVPKTQPTAEKPKPDEAAEKAYADKIRERWVAGEDPAKLQKEAMEHAGISTSPPDVNVGARRAGTLPEAHEPVFDMKAGEISPVYADPASFYIYKVVSIRELPLADVKADIQRTLQRQLINDRIQQIQSSTSTVLNEAYFGPEVSTKPQTTIIRPKGAEAPPNQGSTPPSNSGAPPK